MELFLVEVNVDVVVVEVIKLVVYLLLFEELENKSFGVCRVGI